MFLSHSRKFYNILFYLLFTTFLGLAILHPSFLRMVECPYTVFYCLDASGSISLSEQNEMLKVARSMFHRGERNPKIRQIFAVFGEDFKKTSSLPSTLPIGNGISPEQALNFSQMLISKIGNPGRIVLFTDAGDANFSEDVLQKIRNANIPVFVYYPQAREKDWRFVSLDVPSQVEEGVRIPLHIRYSGNFEGEIMVAILANGQPYLQKKIAVKPHKNGIIELIGNPLTSGFVCFEARGNGDNRPENNVGYATTSIVAHPEILVLTDRLDPVLKRALSIQNIPVEVMLWKEITPKSLPSMKPYPLVILDEPSEEFLQQSDIHWREYLEKGGNILVMNGEKLSSLWLPVQSRKDKPEEKPKPPEKPPVPPKEPIKKEKSDAELELRTVAIVFVLDRSGSMYGDKINLVKAATLASVSKLWVQDMVGVIAFDSEARWVVPLGQGGGSEWTTQKIQELEAGGSTRIAPALLKAYQALSMVSAHIKHVILLSDGYDENGYYARDEIGRLVWQMRKNDITVTSIGVGDDFDPVLMPMIARWGKGEFYSALNYEQIPSIMLRDVDRILNIRRPDRPKLPDSSKEKANKTPTQKEPEKPVIHINQDSKKDNSKLDDVQNEKPSKGHTVECPSPGILLKPFSEFPPVPNYRRYLLNTGAELELTASKEPLLSFWQWGVGKVMVWSSSMESWQDWHSYPKFWSRLVRFLCPNFSQDYHISLECMPYRNSDKEAELRLTLSAPWDDQATNFVVKSDILFYPVDRFQWTAHVPFAETGKWRFVEAEVFQGDQSVGKAKTAFIRPYDAEFNDLVVRDDILKMVAQQTGGGILPSDQEKLFLPIMEPRYQNLEEPLLWIALFLGFIWFFLWTRFWDRLS